MKTAKMKNIKLSDKDVVECYLHNNGVAIVTGMRHYTGEDITFTTLLSRQDLQVLLDATSEDQASRDVVTVPKKEWDDLLDSQRWLLALEDAGVDNWGGYEVAQEIYNNEGEE